MMMMGRFPTLKLSAGRAVVLAAAVLICGKSFGSEATGADGVDSSVVNGENAAKGRFRYMVNLVDDSGKNQCGGTLIHPFVVLTAAHCGSIEIDQVTIGRYDIDVFNGDSPSDYEVTTVEQIAKHPLYSEGSLTNDIMLLRLSTKSNKPTIAINWEGSADLSKELMVLGWGATTTSTQSDILQMADLDYISNEACNNDFGWGGRITDDMMCAQRGIKDSCRGDSGGPLIIPGVNEASDVQVGIVSGGLFGDCTNPTFPGVYSRISESWDDFLMDTLRDWGFDQEVISCSNCVDDPEYRHKGKSNRHCRWVSKKSSRCDKKANAEGCPSTCGICDCPDTCKDDPNHQFKGKAKKDCEWVSKKAGKRCKKEENQEGCPKTCGTC